MPIVLYEHIRESHSSESETDEISSETSTSAYTSGSYSEEEEHISEEEFEDREEILISAIWGSLYLIIVTFILHVLILRKVEFRTPFFFLLFLFFGRVLRKTLHPNFTLFACNCI